MNHVKIIVPQLEDIVLAPLNHFGISPHVTYRRNMSVTFIQVVKISYANVEKNLRVNLIGLL